MKQFSIFVLLFFCLGMAQAQIKFGLRLGGNLASFNKLDTYYAYYDNNDRVLKLTESYPTKPIFTFQVGVVADIPLSDKFSFQPGLLYFQKGTTIEKYSSYESNSVIYYTEENDKIQLNYLEVPLSIVSKTDLGAAKLLVGAGPYFSLGLSGKASFDFSNESYNSATNALISSDGYNDDYTITWKEEEVNQQGKLYLNRMNIGVNFNIGVELRERYLLNFNYGLGLTNIYPDYYDGISTSHRVLSLTATYLFGN